VPERIVVRHGLRANRGPTESEGICKRTIEMSKKPKTHLLTAILDKHV
jgi:hypothetical protein